MILSRKLTKWRVKKCRKKLEFSEEGLEEKKIEEFPRGIM